MKKPNNIRRIREEHFEGLCFGKDVLTKAGKIYEKDGEEAAIDFLMGKDEEDPPNFKPPAKTTIVAQSRPFDQWPIYQVSQAVQERVFAYTEEEFNASKEALFSGDISSKSRDFWFKTNNISDQGIGAQGLNTILSHAFSRYSGVIKKVENRNKKRLKKLSKKNQLKIEEGLEILEFKPDSAFNENGLLAQPPGINPNIYGYQAVTPFVFDPDNPGDVILPKQYEGYSRKPDDIIEKGPSRLDIPKGQPGYVPEHQRKNLKKKGRVRLYRRTPPKTKALASILAVLQIGKDWVLFDMRGLLRSVYMREAATPGQISAKDLLDTFTGCPVLNTRTGEFTFCYKLRSEGALHARKIYTKGETRTLLTSLTSENNTIALVTVDLGQRNPAAIMISRLSRKEELSEKDIQPVSRRLLPDRYLNELKRYRDAYDAFRQEVRDEAFTSLCPEHQEQVQQYEALTPEKAKNLVLKHFFGTHDPDLPWDDMTSNTHYIANLYLERGGDPSKVFFTRPLKKDSKSKKPRKPTKRTDASISRLPEIRPKMPEDARKAFEKAKWEIYTGHEKFPKLAKRVNQLCREIANWIEKEAKRLTLCDTVVVGIEDLSLPPKRGKGKFQETWQGFFRQKFENRWVIDTLKKAIQNRAHDKGKYVLGLAPYWTSQRCPACGFIHKSNRNGDHFKCLKCEALFHADSEVATWNLALVAVLGKGITNPDSKKPSGQKKTGTTRKKQIKGKNKGKETVNVPPTTQEVEDIIAFFEKDDETVRNPVYKPTGT